MPLCRVLKVFSLHGGEKVLGYEQHISKGRTVNRRLQMRARRRLRPYSILFYSILFYSILFSLFVSCDGIGSLYGGMGGSGGGAGSTGSGTTGTGNFTVGDLFSLSNAGDVDAILVLLPGTGENQSADGTFTVELSADDISLPAGGTVTLTVRAADGSIAATGTKTQLVTEGVCDFHVTMADTGPAGPASYRVTRGGHWSSGASVCAVSFRNHDYPNFRYDDQGFRLVRTAP